MTENRITELWNKAVAEIGDCTYPKIITRFAELVAADERERIAQQWDGCMYDTIGGEDDIGACIRRDGSSNA